jgi:hypothetical protein
MKRTGTNPIRWLAILPLVAMVLFLTGCGSNNKGKIEGTKWSSNPTTVKGKAFPAGALGLEFAADGKLVYQVDLARLTGTYSLRGGDTITIYMDQELAGKKKFVEKISITDDTLTMRGPGGNPVTFYKVK